jgi:hypothetical protein
VSGLTDFVFGHFDSVLARIKMSKKIDERMSIRRCDWMYSVRLYAMRCRIAVIPIFLIVGVDIGAAQSVSRVDIFYQSRLSACPSDQDRYWDSCFGAYFQKDGDQYIGEWTSNKITGPGVMLRPNGERYVGNFLEGEFSGVGVEYSPDGSVKNAGRWDRGRLVRSHQVDTSLYPFSFRGSLRSFQEATRDVQIQLESARAELRALRERNAELEKAVKDKSTMPLRSGPNAIQSCVAKGLTPGTAAFSRCIADEK